MRLLPLDPVTIAQTLTEWQASYPQMGVMALLPEAEKGQLPILQTCCRQFGVPLIGAIFPALVTAQGFRSDGVWLFRFDTMVPRFLLPDIATSGLDAADRLADATRGLLAQQGADSAKFTLYLMFDGLIPTIASIIDD